jgi:outer membrane lipoprotein-sorting protein
MITMILLMFTLAAPPADPLGAALERYGAVTTYRVTLRSGVGDTKETIRYFYKKPGFIRMEFIKPHKGALLVYDPTAKTVRLRPFGFASAFILTLSPDNSLVKSAQGHRVDESDMGALLQRVKRLREHGSATIKGEETVGGKDAVIVNVEGEKGYSLEGIHRYLLWLDKQTLLPLKTTAYDSKDDPVEEVLMDDLEVNVPLEDSLFKP